jgi:cytochrome c556/mono/diheme cytochrome c family protein
MLKKILAAAMIAGAGATLAFAEMSPDDGIKARQTAMKQYGKSMGVFVGIFKGEKPYDAAAVKAELDLMGAAYEASVKGGGWAPESAKGTIETWAKPELWSDAEGAKAAGENFGKAFGALAASTDEASFKAAFPAFGEGCKGCHEKFRRAKEG